MSTEPDSAAFRFNRQELAGSLGDVGTLVPIAIGLILINGLNATAVMLGVGLFYLASGLYFRITVPVQPMKVVGAYAIAQALTPLQITTAGFIIGVVLLLLAATGLVKALARLVPRATIRGVQLTTGVLLLMQGVRLILGETALQRQRGAEPSLGVDAVGPLPIGILLGVIAVVVTLLLINNRRAPAALVVLVGGLVVGAAFGDHRQLLDLHLGLHAVTLLPLGWPTVDDATIALMVLALPQLPMTAGNAILAQADLTEQYFGDEAAKRSSHRALAVSMGLANVLCAAIGGMPMCHGAGGLAAHYRFGARTAGSNLMIGLAFLLLGVLIGDEAPILLLLLPLAVLGALLVFAGIQLTLSILDVKTRTDMFVTIAVLGVALTTNLAVGFAVGIMLGLLSRYVDFEVKDSGCGK